MKLFFKTVNDSSQLIIEHYAVYVSITFYNFNTWDWFRWDFYSPLNDIITTISTPYFVIAIIEEL